jgi:hypothetical protein
MNKDAVNILADYHKKIFDDRIESLYEQAQHELNGGRFYGIPIDVNDARQLAAILYQLWKFNDAGMLHIIGIAG